MKWLKSTTTHSYTVNGQTIPPVNREPISMSESAYEVAMKNPVIKSLVKTAGILVMDKYTAPTLDRDASKARIQQLGTENAPLADELRALQKSSAESTEKAKQFDELKAEATQALADKDAEIEKLKAELEKAKAKTKTKNSSKTEDAENGDTE